MKIAILGGGNMGGAIAKGFAQSNVVKPENINVIDINQDILDDIKNCDNRINVFKGDYSSVKSSTIIIIAVKPWVVKNLIAKIKHLINPEQSIVSIAAGISFEQLSRYLNIGGENPALFRVIPNTAIEIGESMNLISSYDATKEQEELLETLFNSLGKTMFLEESLMSAGTALGSCGIAYAFRYIRASMEAGLELGLNPEQSKKIVMQTLKGASELLCIKDSHPEVEIDKVTTPGGITIKGLNELEANGFSNAIIKGIKAGV